MTEEAGETDLGRGLSLGLIGSGELGGTCRLVFPACQGSEAVSDSDSEGESLSGPISSSEGGS